MFALRIAMPLPMSIISNDMIPSSYFCMRGNLPDCPTIRALPPPKWLATQPRLLSPMARACVPPKSDQTPPEPAGGCRTGVCSPRMIGAGATVGSTHPAGGDRCASGPKSVGVVDLVVKDNLLVHVKSSCHTNWSWTIGRSFLARSDPTGGTWSPPCVSSSIARPLLCLDALKPR